MWTQPHTFIGTAFYQIEPISGRVDMVWNIPKTRIGSETAEGSLSSVKLRELVQPQSISWTARHDESKRSHLTSGLLE